MAKKKVESLIDKEAPVSAQISNMRELLKKAFRAEAILKASDAALNSSSLSTGSLKLDLVLGVPFPVGIHELSGGYASGKTTMSMHAIVDAQKKGWPTFLIDIERALNDEFLRRFAGLNVEELTWLKPRTGEEACEMALNIFSTIDNAVVVFDSVAASSATEAIIAKTMSEQTMGALAKLMATFLSKAAPIVDDGKGRLILINQKRDSLSLYGGSDNSPGGNAIKHWSCQRLQFFGENNRDNRILEGDSLIGKKVGVRVLKNRRGRPGFEVEVPIVFSRGIAADFELFSVAKEFGIIAQSASWYTYGDQRFHGEDATLDVLKNNPDMAREILEKIRAIASEVS